MGYIAADDILKAREMDLRTYLRNYEPQELVRVSGNTYCTREHESLRISNGNENPAPEHIHVFESAIDAMSYATMLLLNGRDWKKETFLSLAGVYKTKREKVVPVALERYLKDYPSIKTVHLHLDNDGIGRGAVAGIVSGLQEKYTVLDEPPLHGKDVNDELKIRVGIMREREEIER